MEQQRTPKPPGPRAEARIYGLHGCLALADCRFDDIIRVYLVEERLRDMAWVLKRCAVDRKPYNVVTADELEKITESRHHEGVCIAARPKSLASLEAVLALAETQPGPLCLLALEEIGNPHNVGAILRVAAHFGADGVLIRQPEGSDRILSSAVHRTSEGGAERCRIVACAELGPALLSLRESGFQVVSTSSHASQSLYATKLPGRSVVLLGSENAGLPGELRQQSDLDIAIPGTGLIESLNVSCAAAVFLGEFWHQHRGLGGVARRPRNAATKGAAAKTAAAQSHPRPQGRNKGSKPS